MALEMGNRCFFHLFFTGVRGPYLYLVTGPQLVGYLVTALPSIQDPIRKDLDGRTRVVQQKDKLKWFPRLAK